MYNVVVVVQCFPIPLGLAQLQHMQRVNDCRKDKDSLPLPAIIMGGPTHNQKQPWAMQTLTLSETSRAPNDCREQERSQRLSACETGTPRCSREQPEVT